MCLNNIMVIDLIGFYVFYDKLLKKEVRAK